MTIINAISLMRGAAYVASRQAGNNVRDAQDVVDTLIKNRGK